MVFEVFFSAVLILFFGYCIINATATLPADVAGELSAKQWSIAILVLIILFLAINIVKVIQLLICKKAVFFQQRDDPALYIAPGELCLLQTGHADHDFQTGK